MSRETIYALPTVGIYFLLGPIAIIQGIYAKYFGISLTVIAGVLLVSRLFDAIIDPIIGYISDEYYRSYQSRKPFVLVGSVVYVTSSYFLFVPPEIVSTAYFTIWFILFYFGFTLFDIPHLAWANDLAVSSEEKNTIYSRRAVGVFAGGTLFYAVPLLPIFETNEFTPDTLRASVLIAAVVIVTSLMLTMTRLPNASDGKLGRQRFKQMLSIQPKAIFKNKPLLVFLASFFFFGAGAGMWFGMIFIFTDSYLRLGEKFSILLLSGSLIGMVSIILWSHLARKIEKTSVWSIGVLFLFGAILITGNLNPGVQSFKYLLVVMALFYSGLAAINIIAPSILSDIVDYSCWRYKNDCAASYFSIYTLAIKLNAAVGGAVGLAIAGSSGFDPTVQNIEGQMIFGLRLSVSWLPAIIIMFSYFFIALNPINRNRQSILRRRLLSNIEYKG